MRFIVPPFLTWALVEVTDYVISLTGLRLNLQGNMPQYSLCRRLCWPQSLCGRYGEEESLLPLPGIDPQLLGRPAHSLVAAPTELS
jgi:hypothetical protein